RGTIGVRAQTITHSLATGLSLPGEGSVILGDVAPGSAAEKGAPGVGEVVPAPDGKPMQNGRQFEVNMYRKEPGATVTVTVLRDGRRQDVPGGAGGEAEGPEA